jgi:DNA mismatch repair protein MutL
MPIHILSDETINKIAAGEVVERPANVIKELVENSIDAGSSAIEVEIRDFGKKLIRVMDDGRGMTPEELELAFKRHATSKISDFDDLHSVSSLGFRGEALPSIAAVSKVAAQSQPPGEARGCELRITGGKMGGRREWAGKPGTNIEVSDLFYNTPARLKFMKAASTEKRRMIAIVEELALAWPNIGFKVIADGKTVLTAAPAINTLERAMDILGNEFTTSLTPFTINHPKIKVTGYITHTEASRPARNHQYVFINKRPVQMNKSIYRAVYDAYSENLPKGRHPGLLVFVEIDPSEIDVNIHPTKREVKLSSEGEIYDLFYRSIKSALNKPVSVKLEPYKPLHQEFRSVGVSEIPAREMEFLKREDLGVRPGMNAFQAFGLYLVAQKNDEILIVDQHAAAERIRYEKYLTELEQNRVQVQQMLIPFNVEFTSSRSTLVEENLGLFKAAGWEIDEFGTNTYRITGVPSILGTDFEVRNVLDAMMEAATEGAKLEYKEKLDKIIRAACHKSIKAGDSVSLPEIERLLSDLFLCRAPYTCPHGRPTVFKLTRKELEKYFGRN